ncbi:MAG: M23 family metallopeptidase [Actinobacteria bacterium]|nr:M23 family metallopeptidase [Actinomycetota bacterium]
MRPASSTHYVAAHHDYPATDIFAPKGTDVVAATDGIVDWVSYTDTWDSKVDDPATRGGLSVAIVGDDGVRYYGSHMLDIAAGIKVGSRVAVGTLLGHVDSTGDARGISPHLHFGISHPTTPEDWKVRRGEVRPFEYLNDWRAGKMTTPAVTGAGVHRCRG